MQTHTEEWRACQGFAGCQVSNLGNVRKLNKERQPKQTVNGNGYLLVSIERKGYVVHRLVAAAFCPKPEGCEIVNHLDGNKQNNRADNLEWCTSARNTAHAKETGLIARGESAGNSSLTEAQVRLIDEALNTVEEASAIVTRLGVSHEAVSKIKSGRTWTHITGRSLSPTSRANHGTLTVELVREIDAELQAGTTAKEVASKYGLGYEAIKKIKSGLTWGHVTGRGNTQKAAKTKLTEDDVKAIRHRAAATEPIRAIARDYGMSHSVIGAIVRGETWKHVI